MLTATKDLILPTTVTGSWPRPVWYTGNLYERPFSTARRRRLPRAASSTPLRRSSATRSSRVSTSSRTATTTSTPTSPGAPGLVPERASRRHLGVRHGDDVRLVVPDRNLAERDHGRLEYHASWTRSAPASRSSSRRSGASPRPDREAGQVRHDRGRPAATVLTVKTDLYDDDKRELMWDIATCSTRSCGARRGRLHGRSRSRSLRSTRRCVGAGRGDARLPRRPLQLHGRGSRRRGDLDPHLLGQPRRAALLPAEHLYEASIDIYLNRINADVWTIESKAQRHQLLPRFEPYKGSSRRRSPSA